MQCACGIFSSVACPALQYFFPHYLINGTLFEREGENVIELEMCVLTFSTILV